MSCGDFDIIEKKTDMESFSIYILKSAGLLSLFYLVYLFLLTNDTGFELTRKFLILGIIAAALLPAAVFTKTIFVEPQEATIEPFMIPEDLTDDPMAVQREFLNGWHIAGGIYLLGMTFFNPFWISASIPYKDHQIATQA